MSANEEELALQSAPAPRRPRGNSTACRMTAAGRGAIAVIRIQGSAALEIASQVFRPATPIPLRAGTPARPRLGRVGENFGDEVVAVVLDRSGSTVEFHCHGGTAAVDAVLDALERAGATKVSAVDSAVAPDEMTIREEALRDLVNAPTARVAEILLEQAHGALNHEIDRLIGLIADHEKTKADVVFAALADRASAGLRLLSGWRIAIVGRPNVGKSRLLNAFAGYQRAIVDPTPGTTRDTVTLVTALAGWPVQIVDTAGIRATSDLVEALGLARSQQAVSEADLVLLVLDSSVPLDTDDRRLLGTIPHPLVVINKSDLAPAWPPSEIDRDSGSAAVVSAETGSGILELIDRIASRLVPNPLPAGAAVPFRERHIERLECARRAFAANDRDAAIREIRSLIADKTA